MSLAAQVAKRTIRGGTRITPSKFDLRVTGPPLAQIGECKLVPSVRCASVNQKGFPSVTLIQTCVDDKTELLKWQEAKISELGQTRFRAMMQERVNSGSSVHKKIEGLLSIISEKGVLPDKQTGIGKVSDTTEGYLESVYPYLESIEMEPGSLLMEKPVTHGKLQYKGRFDAIFNNKGKLTMFEWKTATAHSAVSRNTSTSLSSAGLYGYPRQLAAYVAALNSDANFSNQIRYATVVVATDDGNPARVIEMDEEDLEKHWTDFKAQLHDFWSKIQNSKGDVIFTQGW